VQRARPFRAPPESRGGNGGVPPLPGPAPRFGEVQNAAERYGSARFARGWPEPREFHAVRCAAPDGPATEPDVTRKFGSLRRGYEGQFDEGRAMTAQGVSQAGRRAAEDEVEDQGTKIKSTKTKDQRPRTN
jgi:hypothetical protein